MKSLNKLIISSILTANLAFSAGIPVIDAVANAQAMAQNIKEIAEWAKEAQRWVETASHFKSQIEAYQRELESKTGIRNSVAFIRDVKDIYSSAKNIGLKLSSIKDFNLDSISMLGSLTNRAKELMNKYFTYDRCNALSLTESQNLCYQKQMSTVENIAFLEERREAISEYTKDLNRLATKLKNSQDIKESADISNAIQLKVALLQAEKTQIDLMNEQIRRNQEVMEEKAKEISLKQWNTPLSEELFRN